MRRAQRASAGTNGLIRTSTRASDSAALAITRSLTRHARELRSRTITSNFQISGKAADGRIYVIGGENFAEFSSNLQDIYGPQADRVIEDFNFLVDPPSPPLPQSAPASAPARAAQAAPPAPGAPTCAHGPRSFRSSKPGAAKQWQAWMCPTPQGTPDQCKPEWV